MKFKDKTIEGYWKRIDDRIRTILLFVDMFTQAKFRKEIMVTDLMRLRIHQIIIYKRLEKYKDIPESEIPHSVHEYGRGADFRVTNFTEEEITDIMELINKIPYGDKRYMTALRHDIGTGDHIHVQVRYRG